MNFKCIIIDDEPLAVDVLERHLENIPGFEVVQTFGNALDAINYLASTTVDLMFLDIQMPKLMGHAFLRTLKNPPKVIFTTAHKEYALEAFELEAVDYLLKPVSLERLIRAVNKISREPITHAKKEEFGVDNKSFLYLKADRKMVKVRFDEIVYIESMKDYVKIYRSAGPPLVVKQSISSLEELLPSNLFVRVHRSFIVAINKVTAYTAHDVQIDAIEIPVGRLFSNSLQSLTGKI